MAEKQSAKQRTQVEDLPREEESLNTEDMKKVKGGYSDGGEMIGATCFRPNPSGDGTTQHFIKESTKPNKVGG